MRSAARGKRLAVAEIGQESAVNENPNQLGRGRRDAKMGAVGAVGAPTTPMGVIV